MKILITGGTGFIGHHLAKFFTSQKYHVTVLTRDTKQKTTLPIEVELIEKLALSSTYDVIINLAGYPLNKQRWSQNVKQKIYQSRIETTKTVIDYLSACPQKPKVFLSGSAIGVYGADKDQSFTEEFLIEKKDFAANLCASWEEVALQAEQYGIRVCLLRTGVVLAANGGALGQMLLPFKFGLGAILGNGQGWLSWIHIADFIGIIELLINNPQCKGPINLTAPQPVTNREFSVTLANILRRPLFMRLPSFMVQLIFGEMGDALLLQAPKVTPWKIMQANYNFKFPVLKQALLDLLHDQ